MAELIRTQGYRTQVQGVPGAATPSVSFGQRRPEIAFQAQANYQNNIAQAIDRMSNTLFGLSETFGQEAGQQYVAENRITEQQLKDMVAGKVDPELVSGSPMNVYSAAVRKARAIEVSGHVLAEGRKLANDLMIQAEEGKVDTKTATSNLSSFMDNAGSSLAQIDPDASLRFRANMATIGSTVIDKVAQVELKRRQAVNRAKMDLSKEHLLGVMNNLLTQTVVSVESPLIYQTLATLEESFYNEASVMLSPAAAEGYRTEFRKDIELLKLNLVAGYVTGADDPIAAFDQLRKGKTQNEFINSLVAPTGTNRIAMLDAARKELSAFNTLEEQRVAENERQAVKSEADFADALAAGDRERMNAILDDVRSVSPKTYSTLKKVLSEGGGVFAFTDNGNVVADLESRLNEPYGPKVTVNEVFNKRNLLTQGTFSKFMNAATAMEDKQVRLMEEQAASMLGMRLGAVLMPGVERARQERALSDLKVKFFNERQRNPNVDVFQFLKDNFKDTQATATATTDSQVFQEIQSFTYKTRESLDKAIRDAQNPNSSTYNADQANTLKQQRIKFEDAIKNGVIDENGKRITKQ
jgi:uncharacterized protein YdcH (DUF465 family)